MASHIAYIDNDNMLKVTLSGETASGVAIDFSGATVTVTLEETTGTDVTGETWPLSMTYISGTTSALFAATLTDTLTLAAATDYQAVISGNNGDGQAFKTTVPVDAQVRAPA